MQKQRLIGYPRAALPWLGGVQVGAGVVSSVRDGSLEPVPTLVFTRYAIDRADMTGATGAGAVKRPRPVGVGLDPEQQAAADAAVWLAAEDIGDDTREAVASYRQTLADKLALSDAVSVSILMLAGGLVWANGGRPSIHSGGMAAKAARYVWGKRGVMPSGSSIDEAAAAGAGAIWEAWTHLQAFLGEPDFAAHVRTLAGVGWRASFRSLTAGGRAFNGRHAEELITVPMDEAANWLDQASLAEWARGGARSAPRAFASSRFARRLCLAWIKRTLGADRGGRAGQSARAQVRVLAWLLCGATWGRAARAGGFTSGATAGDAFAQRGVWARLEAAASDWTPPGEAALSVQARCAGMAAGQAVEAHRAVSRGAAARGVAGYAVTARRRAVVDRRVVVGVAVDTGTRRAVIGSPVADAWRVATDKRGRAVARAVRARRAVNSARAARVARWQRAARGFRSAARA